MSSSAASLRYADRYRVLRRLGAGGMATVFLAEDERLGRQVAVKRLHAEGPEDMARRFGREARLGASLNHPNLVAVYDTVTDPEGVLIIMEYVPGPSLAGALKRDPLPRERSLAMVRQIAAGLDHAHRHGIVHRDVKPANILLADGGEAKLADLGIAFAVERATHITRTGTVLGTPSYMAPEQLEGREVGPAVDVYALAAVTFEVLSGRKARTGGSPLEIAQRIATESAPELREAWPEAPPAAAELLCEAMAFDPARRPESAGELAERLEAALEGLDDSAAPARPAEGGGAAVAGAAAGAGLAAGASGAAADEAGARAPGADGATDGGETIEARPVPVREPAPEPTEAGPVPVREPEPEPTESGLGPEPEPTEAGAVPVSEPTEAGLVPEREPTLEPQDIEDAAEFRPTAEPVPDREPEPAAEDRSAAEHPAADEHAEHPAADEHAEHPAADEHAEHPAADGHAEHPAGAPAPAAAGSAPPSNGRSAQRRSPAPSSRRRSRPAWLAPAALLLVLGGVAVTAILATTGDGGGETAPTERGDSPAPARDRAGSNGSERTAPARTNALGPAATVTSFYERAAADDFDGAWELAGPGYRSQLGGYDSFRATLDSLESIEFRQAEPRAEAGDSTEVAIRTVATHSDGVDRCRGTLTVTPGGATGWLIDRANVSCPRSTRGGGA